VENVVDGALHRRRRVTGVEESTRRWLRRCLVRGPVTERLIDYRSKGTGQRRDQGRWSDVRDFTKGPVRYLRRSKSQCQTSQMMQGLRESWFDKGSDPVMDKLVWWCVNVMMTRWSSVLVEIKGVGVREWKSLWPLAAGLTMSCGAVLPRRTMPADAPSTTLHPYEHYRTPSYLALLMILCRREMNAVLRGVPAIMLVHADQIEMLTTGRHTVGVPVAMEVIRWILVTQGVRMIAEIVEIMAVMVTGGAEVSETFVKVIRDHATQTGPGRQGAVMVRTRIRRWARETSHQWSVLPPTKLLRRMLPVSQKRRSRLVRQ